MKKIILFLFVLITVNQAFSQESNNDKKLWAKSILNQAAPELVVEKWLSEQPNTKGKFILIDFWATWCEPCKKFIPALNDFQKKYADQLVVIGLSTETEEKVTAMKTPEIAYSEAIDTQGRLNKQLEILGIPHAILIDPKGVVRWEGFPLLTGYELNEEVLVGLMKKYKN
ncbi:TlpA family protein disulfide reductase [Pedobacter sp. MW01-1-1]|uniref:TlpA family protein disulfide reductase n=1 Tax=Pedobacter sp. MW01-1-1 TaxID=3383027 RepID=UPI003FEE8498